MSNVNYHVKVVKMLKIIVQNAMTLNLIFITILLKILFNVLMYVQHVLIFFFFYNQNLISTKHI